MATQASAGGRIRLRRQQLGLTQAELAGRVGVSESTVIRWEGGKMPPTRHRGRLEAVLDIGLDDGPPSQPAPGTGGGPLTEEEREKAMQEFLRLGRILFPPAGQEQDTGVRGGHMHDEGRTA